MRATKTVSDKDTGYDDPEDDDNKGAVASSKAGNGAVRAIIVKASPGKFECQVTVMAAVEDEVANGGEQMKGGAHTNTHNYAGTNVCVNNTTMATTPVVKWQRHQSNVGFG